MSRVVLKYVVICLAVILYQIISNSLSIYNKKDFVVILNVGQGDSILLASENDYLLIDGGPSSSSTNKIYRYTLNKKPKNLLLTHNHSDHFSGFYKLTSNPINYDFFYSRKVFNFFNRDLKATQLNSGDKIYLGNFAIRSLWPKKGCVDLNPNLCSSVLSITHKNGSTVILFGDAENTVQSKLVPLLPRNIFGVKVAHHGSRDGFNKKVIDKLRPKNAYISVGKNNYGHPSNIVVSYYSKIGSRVYRTDKNGDIIMFFN